MILKTLGTMTNRCISLQGNAAVSAVRLGLGGRDGEDFASHCDRRGEVDDSIGVGGAGCVGRSFWAGAVLGRRGNSVCRICGRHLGRPI